MPNIHEYGADNIALRPNDRGVNAADQAGRRINALYDDVARSGRAAAGAFSDIGHQLGQGVSDLGSAWVQMEDHDQITKGAAAYATLTATLSKQWDDILKNADPNNPALAGSFQAQVLEPALAKFQESFTTERAQEWAASHSGQMREHFAKRTISDQASLAAKAVSVNIDQLGNQYTNAAVADPASLDFLLKQTDDAIGSIVDTSPTLSAEAAANIKSQVAQSLKEKIARAAVQSAIIANPEAGLKLAQDPKYALFLDGAAVNTLHKEAERALKADAANDYILRERAQKQASEQITDRVITEIYGGDHDVTMQDILKIPQESITRTDREHLLGVLEKRTVGVPTEIAQRNAVDLITGIHAGTVNDMEPVKKALAENKIDYQRFKEVQAELTAQRSPEGQTLTNARTEFLKNFQPLVNPLSRNADGDLVHSADGYRRAYQLQQYARQRETEIIKKGGDPHVIYDPRSPEYIGNTPFARPTSSADLLRSLSQKTVPYGPPVPAALSPVPAPQLSPGDIVKGYKFKGGDPSNPESWEKE